MLLRCGFRSDAVRVARVGAKLAIWFKLARVCAGVCSVFMRSLPRLMSFRKPRLLIPPLLVCVPTPNGSFGQCSGAQCVSVSTILCKALEAACALYRNSIVLISPPLVIKVIVAPFSAPPLSNSGTTQRARPSVLKLYCISFPRSVLSRRFR